MSLRAHLGVVVMGITFVFHPVISAAHFAGPTDACALLTGEQVSAVLGVKVGAGQRVAPTNALICGWTQPSDTNHTGKRVALTIYGQLGSRTPAERFATAKTPAPKIQKTPVAGVGDDAFYATTPGIGTGLIFKKGDSAFDLRVYGFPVEEIKAKEKTLAAAILGKM
jgi:hypothetical protein